MSKLTVLIPCFNSEKVVRPTLESVKWADEILACDSFSTDKTLEMMREYGARIIQHEYINSAAQKNWAIPQCSHDWILIVDTDEKLEAGLKEEIEKIVRENDARIQAYRIPRKNFVYGTWLKYGGLYPDYQIRLFRKGAAYYQAREVHAPVNVQGKVGTLEHHFLHNGFKNISDWFLKMDRYSRYESEQLIKQNKRFSYFRLLVGPPVIFLRNYFLRLGFMQGYEGFIMALLDSYYYSLIYMKLRERQNFDA